MTTNKTFRVIWSPHEGSNRFIVGSPDLRMYEYVPKSRSGESPLYKIIAVNSDFPLAKCFAWSPDASNRNLLAVGLSNGRTVLLTLSNDALLHPAVAPIHQEYPILNVKYSRACAVVAFSKKDPNLLVTGLEKQRHDHCLHVWDISRQTSKDSRVNNQRRINNTNGVLDEPLNKGESTNGLSERNSSNIYGTSTLRHVNFPVDNGVSETELSSNSYTADTTATPLASYGYGDALVSCEWFPTKNEIVAGLGTKYLKIFDPRAKDQTTPPLSLQTKAVNEIRVDPFNEYRFTSFEENIVYLWDIRKLTEPISSH